MIMVSRAEDELGAFLGLKSFPHTASEIHPTVLVTFAPHCEFCSPEQLCHFDQKLPNPSPRPRV